MIEMAGFTFVILDFLCLRDDDFVGKIIYASLNFHLIFFSNTAQCANIYRNSEEKNKFHEKTKPPLRKCHIVSGPMHERDGNRCAEMRQTNMWPRESERTAIECVRKGCTKCNWAMSIWCGARHQRLRRTGKGRNVDT